jgi:hypothetical protein
MKNRSLFLSMLALLSWLSIASADKALTPDQAAQKVEIRNVQVKGNIITAEVINKSPHPLSNLELLIQYHWLWNNEFKPGDPSPGKAVFVPLDKELRPGESTTFTAPLDPPPASRADGYYLTEVTLAAFTEIIHPTVG